LFTRVYGYYDDTSEERDDADDEEDFKEGKPAFMV
jgi:hypothetical protein